MKKQILWGLGLVLGTILSTNGQNVASTTTLTSGGNGAGTAGTTSTYYGREAGMNATGSSGSNTFVGHSAGRNTTAGSNTYVGYYAGIGNSSGLGNVGVGNSTGRWNGAGSYNVLLGSSAGSGTSGGVTWSNNVYLGAFAGYNNNTGSDNICIGKDAGRNSSGSNHLYITNEEDSTPLIYGDFAQENLIFNGKVGITEEALVDQGNLFPSTAGGVSVANYQLFVRGGILTEAVRVQLETAWADYVFAPDYELPTLEAVESYIQENGHLPNIPSAEQVKSDGIELGEMAKLQQEKIEELTLYAIDQDKHIDSLETTVAKQQQEMEAMKAQIKLLLEKQ